MAEETKCPEELARRCRNIRVERRTVTVGPWEEVKG